MIKIHWVSPKTTPVTIKAQRRQMLLERAVILYMLEPRTIYTPSAVAATAYPARTAAYTAARKAFGDFSRCHNIDITFDNIDKGYSDDYGWFGDTWVDNMADVTRMRVTALMDELKQLLAQRPGQYYLLNEKLIHEQDLPNELKPSLPLPVLPVREGLTPARNETGMAVLKPLRPADQPPLGKFLSVIQPKKKKRHIKFKHVLGDIVIIAAAITASYLYSLWDDQRRKGMDTQYQILNDD